MSNETERDDQAETKGVIGRLAFDLCVWKEDLDGNWQTDCGHIHVLFDGTPHQNDYSFCPYCGKRLSQNEGEYPDHFEYGLTGQPSDTTNPMSNEAEIEERVIAQIRGRRDKGRAKYGTTMERTDLTPREWIQHLKEELMDAVIYAEKLKSEMEVVWRPIETAPEDKPVLVGSVRVTGQVLIGWTNSGKWYGWPYVYQPTHWMPMPEPPMEKVS